MSSGLAPSPRRWRHERACGDRRLCGLAHAVSPEAAADIIVCLVSDAAAPVSDAIVPAYGP
jgi:hypothetical protein